MQSTQITGNIANHHKSYNRQSQLRLKQINFKYQYKAHTVQAPSYLHTPKIEPSKGEIQGSEQSLYFVYHNCNATAMSNKLNEDCS